MLDVLGVSKADGTGQLYGSGDVDPGNTDGDVAICVDHADGQDQP